MGTITPLPASLEGWSARQIREAKFERQQRANVLFHATEEDPDAAAEHIDEIKELNDDLDRLNVADAAAGGGIQRHPGHPPAGRGKNSPRGGSIAEAFLKGVRKQRGHGGAAGFNVDLRAELDGPVGGTTVPAFWAPGINEIAGRRTFLRSLIPSDTTTSSVVHYTQQTVQTNNAAVVAAHAVKPTSVYTVEDVEAPVVVIAHMSQPMDRSVLMDFAALQAFLDGQLRLGVLLAEETYILNDATAGILHQVGLQTQAKGALPAPDAVRKAITKVENQNVAPTAAVFHPNDWEDIATLTTADGQYIWGSPAGSEPQTIWGLPVVTSTLIAEGTGLVGNFADGAHIWDRQQTEVRYFETGLSATTGHDLAHSNELVWRGEERIAFGVPFPAYFCTVTGL